MSRLLLIALLLESGFVLLVVPWSSFWDRNYFAAALPLLHEFITNNFVRGAISGLGVVNLVAGIVDLYHLLSSRHSRPSRPSSIVPPQAAEE